MKFQRPLEHLSKEHNPLRSSFITFISFVVSFQHTYSHTSTSYIVQRCVHFLTGVDIQVLSECPIVVVLLFQLYQHILPKFLSKFIPQVIRALKLTPPPNANITHRPLYADFIGAQIKVYFFISVFLLIHSEEIQQCCF